MAEQTRARAAETGLPLVELDRWYDVDEPATLARLTAELRNTPLHGAFAAPRTAAFLSAQASPQLRESRENA